MTEATKKNLYKICMKHKEVLIVDVLNYLHRYLWVNRDMIVYLNGGTVCTGHLFGFTKMLTYLKDKYPDCAIVLALDGIDKTRRKTNPEYKAQRDHATARVDAEMKELLLMCSLVDGVYTCLNEDYEADDVISVVAHKVRDLCVRNNIEKMVYILSTDKDMYQLVTDEKPCPIHVIKRFGYPQGPKGAEVIDEAGVKEKFGVCPKDLVKYRAIVGDPSDNLKGYYRFRKANAAIIAENFDYDEEKKLLYLKDGVKPCQSWRRFLSVVCDDMQTFDNNYYIMKLKDFDFEIDDIQDTVLKGAVSEAVYAINKYKLNQYTTSLCAGRYSRYRNEIIRTRSHIDG